MSYIKTSTITLTALCGGAIVNMLGGWTRDMQTLLLLIGLDFITGLLIATVFKNSTKTNGGALESRACVKGLFRKCMILIFVMVAHEIDVTLNIEYVRTTVIIGFITNELISLVENAGLMGIKLPNVITNSIEILQNKSESQNNK